MFFSFKSKKCLLENNTLRNRLFNKPGIDKCFTIMLTEMELETNQWDIVIIGGGQSGLALGYFLKKMNKQFIILDENNRVGDSWRRRWDSLKLFTPSQHDGLPGMPFPGSKGSFPGKDEMADYLERYVNEYSLPVRLNLKVNHLFTQNNHYEIDNSGNKLIARKVVIATGTNPFPNIPALSSDISREIFQVHSSGYTNPDLLPPGDVLVVGAATSGIEIALEISKTHRTFISGNPPFHIPDKAIRYGGELYWWFISNILTIRTPIGKKVRKKIIHGGSPLIRVSSNDLRVAGITSLPRVAGVEGGYPKLEDRTILKVKSIIWATGYRPDFSWIGMNVTDETGWPISERGISSVKKGLYFMGMPFQFGLTSGLVGGVGRDAAYIAWHIKHN
jgi:putative flavoprotein involved in K+ transport